MNQKEVSELRRRFSSDKNAVSHVYGCYVNGGREMITEFCVPLGTATQEENDKYLELLKKSLSGTVGRNLLDIPFSTQQVMDSPEHRLLSALKSSRLKDDEARRGLYQKIISSLDMGGRNYVILMASDAYDVPRRRADGEKDADLSDEVFTYIICSVCPVNDGRIELGYSPSDNMFHGVVSGQVVASPELGFLFPAFDDRSANIHSALFYTKSAGGVNQGFIEAVFNTEAPLSAEEQKEAFQSALSEALEQSCSFDVVRAVHEQLSEMMAEHKESKDPEPLEVTPREVGQILRDCGVEDEKIAAFGESCRRQFGGDAMDPANLIDVKRFEVKTPEATVTIGVENSYQLETRMINGRKYLLIPVDDSLEVNGIPVSLAPEKQEL